MSRHHDDRSFFSLFTPPALCSDPHVRKVSQAIDRLEGQANEGSLQATDALGRIRVMKGDMSALAEHVATIERRVFGVSLYCRTILQLLVDKGLLTAEEFAGRMDELDLVDGQRDGR
jgi:hypothetical protein